MNTKIKELTESIYQDGVSKAREEADRILKEATQKAEDTKAKAEAEAKAVLSEAKSESEKMYASMNADLQAIKKQVLEISKQEVTNLVTVEAAKNMASKVAGKPDVLKELMLEISKNWQQNNGQGHLEALVPQKMAGELDGLIKQETSEALGKKLVIKPVPGLRNGFQIVNDNGSFKLSFTDEDFETFFASLMKPKIREYLFSAEK